MFIQVLILEFFISYQSYEGEALANSLLFIDPLVRKEKERGGEGWLLDGTQELVSKCGPGRQGGRSHGVQLVVNVARSSQRWAIPFFSPA